MCKLLFSIYIFFFKQKTAYEMRISDWSSDVCSSDLKVLEEVRAVAFAQRLEAAQVADRRVQPDVQELARVAGDLEAEVGRVARDVPGAQAAFAVQPLLQLGLDPGHGDVAGQPVAQEARELADLEEEVLRLAQLRRGATDHRVGRLELGRRIRCAAVLAVVAVLVRRAAVGADALDVAV